MSTKKRTPKKSLDAPALAKKLPSLYEVFGRNFKAEDEGVWVDIPFAAGQILQFKLRSLNSETSRKFQEDFKAPHLDLIRRAEKTENKKVREMADKLFRDMIEETIINVIVIDWKGIGDENGKPLKCTPDAVRAAIQNPALTEFFGTILAFANSKETFKTDDRKAAEKN